MGSLDFSAFDLMTLKLIPNYHIPAHISAVFNVVRDLPPNLEYTCTDIIIEYFSDFCYDNSRFLYSCTNLRTLICTDHHHVRMMNQSRTQTENIILTSYTCITQMSAEEEPRPIGLVPNKYSAIFVGVISIDYERHKPNCSSIASFDSEIQRVFILLGIADTS